MCAALDLNARALDVRRLVKAHPSFRGALERGHDADELLQEVWLGLLVRQQGRSAYDPARGSFSKWVYIIVRSVVSHSIERQCTRARHEQVGCQDEEGVTVDANAWADAHVAHDVNEGEDQVIAEIAPVGEIAAYLVQGHSVRSAQKHFGLRWHGEVTRIARQVGARLAETTGTTQSLPTPSVPANVTRRDKGSPQASGIGVVGRVCINQLIPYGDRVAKSVQTNVQFAEEVREVLGQVAAEECTSVASIVRRATIRWLEQQGRLVVTPPAKRPR